MNQRYDQDLICGRKLEGIVIFGFEIPKNFTKRKEILDCLLILHV